MFTIKDDRKAVVESLSRKARRFADTSLTDAERRLMEDVLLNHWLLAKCIGTEFLMCKGRDEVLDEIRNWMSSQGEGKEGDAHDGGWSTGGGPH